MTRIMPIFIIVLLTALCLYRGAFIVEAKYVIPVLVIFIAFRLIVLVRKYREVRKCPVATGEITAVTVLSREEMGKDHKNFSIDITFYHENKAYTVTSSVWRVKKPGIKEKINIRINSNEPFKSVIYSNERINLLLEIVGITSILVLLIFYCFVRVTS